MTWKYIVTVAWHGPCYSDQVLEASLALARAWRVAYVQAEKEMGSKIA